MENMVAAVTCIAVLAGASALVTMAIAYAAEVHDYLKDRKADRKASKEESDAVPAEDQE